MPEFTAFRLENPENTFRITLSRTETISRLFHEICRHFDIDDSDTSRVRIWGGADAESHNDFQVYDSLDDVIGSSSIEQNRFIMVEVREGFKWPSEATYDNGYIHC